MDLATALLTAGTWAASAVTTILAIRFQDRLRHRRQTTAELEALVSEFSSAAGEIAMQQYLLHDSPDDYSVSTATAVAARALQLVEKLRFKLPELADDVQRLQDAATDLFESKDDPAIVIERAEEFAEFRNARDAMMEKARTLIDDDEAPRRN